MLVDLENESFAIALGRARQQQQQQQQQLAGASAAAAAARARRQQAAASSSSRGRNAAGNDRDDDDDDFKAPRRTSTEKRTAFATHQHRRAPATGESSSDLGLWDLDWTTTRVVANYGARKAATARAFSAPTTKPRPQLSSASFSKARTSRAASGGNKGGKPKQMARRTTSAAAEAETADAVNTGLIPPPRQLRFDSDARRNSDLQRQRMLARAFKLCISASGNQVEQQAPRAASVPDEVADAVVPHLPTPTASQQDVDTAPKPKLLTRASSGSELFKYDESASRRVPSPPVKPAAPPASAVVSVKAPPPASPPLFIATRFFSHTAAYVKRTFQSLLPQNAATTSLLDFFGSAAAADAE